jgi:hypothetical protein
MKAKERGQSEHNEGPIFYTRLTKPSNFVEKLRLVFMYVARSETAKESKRQCRRNRAGKLFCKFQSN